MAISALFWRSINLLRSKETRAASQFTSNWGLVRLYKKYTDNVTIRQSVVANLSERYVSPSFDLSRLPVDLSKRVTTTAEFKERAAREVITEQKQTQSYREFVRDTYIKIGPKYRNLSGYEQQLARPSISDESKLHVFWITSSFVMLFAGILSSLGMGASIHDKWGQVDEWAKTALKICSGVAITGAVGLCTHPFKYAIANVASYTFRFFSAWMDYSGRIDGK